MGFRPALHRRLLWRWWALAAVLVMSMGVVASASRVDASLSAPTGLSVLSVLHERVQLQWEGTRSQSYRIYWEVAGQPDINGSNDAYLYWAGPGLVKATTASELEIGTTYIIHVVEVVNGVESPPSNQVTVTTLSEVPVDVRVVTANSFSVNLAWAGITGDWYRIDWHVADDPQSTGTMTLQWRRSRYPEPIGVNAVVSGLSPTTTYIFEIVHLAGGPDGEASAPSDPLVFTTPPYSPPAVEAQLDGNDVTLSWPRPANVHAQLAVHYDVYVDGVLETRISTTNDPVRITLPRQTSGATHQYAVRHTGWIDPSITDPVAVTIPPADDTTPPTTPGWIWTSGPPLDCFSPEYPEFEIVQESTDDTTPQAEIHYEAFLPHPVTRELYVADYDSPLTGPRAPELIRAVDEAGNRSDTSAGTEVFPDC